MPLILLSSLMAWGISAISMELTWLRLKHYFPLAFIVVMSPFFFVSGPDQYTTRLFSALWDCGHVVFFAVLVAAVNLRWNLRSLKHSLCLICIVFVCGGLIELVQTYIGRDGNWLDLLRDLTGTCLGLLWLQQPTKIIWYARFFALFLLLPSVNAVVKAAYGQIHAARQFPLLNDFESVIELQSIRGPVNRAKDYATSHAHSLKINFTTDEYSEVSFNDLYQSWEGFRFLSIDLYKPDDLPLAVIIRINDRQHELGANDYSDRYNKKFSLNQGWNHLEISITDIQHAPATRLMDLRQIQKIVVFSANLKAPRDIYLDNIRLR